MPDDWCDIDNDELCEFILWQFERKQSTSWISSRYGQIVLQAYFKKYGKNPVIKNYVKYSDELRCRETWRHTVQQTS